MEDEENSEEGFVDYNKVKMDYIARMEAKKADLLKKFTAEEFERDGGEDPSFRGSIGNEIDSNFEEEGMTPEQEYELAYGAYQMEMIRYNIATTKYEQFQSDFAHVDFTLLDFLPELQEVEYFKQYKQDKLEKDLRFIRTKQLLNNPDGLKDFDEELDRRYS